jgi:DNA-directed RNA polymerase specialized sigma subunit
MLKQLREKPAVAEKRALTMPNTREMAENLRHSALKNLKKRDRLIARRNSLVRRFVRAILGQQSVISPEDLTDDLYGY